jgi:GntR family transcriptional regulator
MNPRLTLSPEVAGIRLRRADRARQMADVLRRQVMHGLLDGEVLPSEPALASDFGVSRNTVREALELLRREGLVHRIPGVGTVAAQRKYLHGIDQLMGLAETLPGPVRNEVRVAGLVEAPAAVARRLDLVPGEPVIHLERRRFADDVPLSLDLTYLPADVGEPLLDQDLAGRDVFALLEELTGRRLGTAEIVLEAVAADRHSAAILEVPAGAPLLMLERLTRLDDGRPVDLEFVRFRGDRITMRGTVRRTPEEEINP